MRKCTKNLIIYIIYLVVCVGLLEGCKGHYECKPQKKPANIKPIDCKNFNDVTTTYWNLYRDCESLEIKPPCDTLLVEGWGCKMDYNCIYLCPDSASAKKWTPIALYWRGIGDEDDIDYYYISCTLVRLYDGKPMRYLVELIGDRIYQETENKTGR